MAKMLVELEFEPAFGPPLWPKMWEGDVWDPKGEPNGGTGKLAWECNYAFQETAIPSHPPELQQCLDALEAGGPLACAGFSPEVRGLLAHLLQAGASAESENCNYEASRCLAALVGADDERDVEEDEDE